MAEPPEQWDRYYGVPEPGSMAAHVAGPYATRRLASTSLARHEALEDDRILRTLEGDQLPGGPLVGVLGTCAHPTRCASCCRRRRYLSDQALALRLRARR